MVSGRRPGRVQALGLTNKVQDARAVFAEYDANADGRLTFRELNDQLRQQADPIGPYEKHRRQRKLPANAMGALTMSASAPQLAPRLPNSKLSVATEGELFTTCNSM